MERDKIIKGLALACLLVLGAHYGWIAHQAHEWREYRAIYTSAVGGL